MNRVGCFVYYYQQYSRSFEMRHCASLAESKGLAPFSIFFCKQKQHVESRAQLTDLQKELEKYIGKLGSTVVDSKIQFSVNFMFRKRKKTKTARNDYSRC